MKILGKSFFIVIFLSFCFELITGVEEPFDLEFNEQVLFFLMLFLVGILSVVRERLLSILSILSAASMSMLGAFLGHFLFFIFRSEFDALLIIGLIYFFIFSLPAFAGALLYSIFSYAFWLRK